MRKRIFKTMMLISALILVISMAAVMAFTYDYFEKRSLEMLAGEAEYIAQAVRQEGIDYFSDFDPQERVTWIDAAGNVLFDSDTDAAAMENHSDRPEVQQALETGRGQAERDSSTFGSKTLYYALRLEDGSVLRVSCQQRTVYRLFLDMLKIIFCIAAVVLILGAVLSYQTARRIVEPINEIDLENPEQSEAYDELSPLLYRMITQKHKIAAQMRELRANRDELEAITENMSEGFLLLNREKKVVALNHSAAELFEQQSDQAVGHHVIGLNRSPELLQAVEQALNGENAEQTLQIGGKSYALMANPVYTDGVRSGVTVFILDVTEKVQAEQLRRQFSANVSHELKTPLTSIAGYDEIMQSGMVKAEDIPAFAGRIKQEATRMIRLVEDIIRLSQLDERNVQLEREQVPMLALARQVMERLEPAAAGKQVHLQVEGQEGEVNGVRAILDEMLYNLCDNAIKYNRTGGSVCLTVTPTPETVEIAVQDTGIGIAREEQEKVFERFYRVDKSHSRQTGGTGLGLSIVKHGALFHNAKIEMQSVPGEGTCVKVILPRESA